MFCAILALDISFCVNLYAYYAEGKREAKRIAADTKAAAGGVHVTVVTQAPAQPQPGVVQMQQMQPGVAVGAPQQMQP